jgi:hypothetical protein
VTRSELKLPTVTLEFVAKIEGDPSLTDPKTFPETKRDVPDAEVPIPTKFAIEFTLRVEAFARVTDTLVVPIDVENRFPRTLSAFAVAAVPIPTFETKLVRVTFPMLPVLT